MSRKNKKLAELSDMFSDIDTNFEYLSSESINDIVLIFIKWEDAKYEPNVKHIMIDITILTLFALLAKCNE